MFNALFELNSDVYRTTIGDVEIFVISLRKGDAPLDKLILDSKAKQDVVSKAPKQERNSQNIMLLRHKDFIALIDTGFPYSVGILQKRLKTIGVGFSDITHVIITHGHFDHIGGILDKDNKLNFPNATLLVDKKEFDFWLTHSDTRAKVALQSFSKRIFFNHSKPLFNASTKISAIEAYGHTPGHNMISLESSDKKLIFWADLMHVFGIQNTNPHIAISYDNNPAEAIETREQILGNLRANKIAIIGAHMPSVAPIVLE